MAKEKKRPSRQGPTDAGPDWKHLLLAGSLVGAVLATLILGAVLQVDSDTVTAQREQDLIARTTPAMPTPLQVEPPPREAPAQPEPATPVPADPLTADRRGRDDLRRAAPAATEWTLKFMVSCLPETAEGVLREIGDDPALYLLPVRLDGRACFRICWGRLGSREAALAARGIPAPLAQLNAEPVPRRIADLLP
jgi:hypothetical protein